MDSERPLCPVNFKSHSTANTALVLQLLGSIFRHSTSGHLMTLPEQRSMLRADGVKPKVQLTQWSRERAK